MKRTPLILISIVSAWLTGASRAPGQGTAFTYQGSLTDSDSPATGSYSLLFVLYNAQFGGNQVGPSLTNQPVKVAKGLFTTTLDFGAVSLDGSPRWLELAVRTNGSADAFTLVSPRQPLTPAPYAVRAASFSGVIADSQLSANVARLNLSQIFSGANTFNGANTFTGGNTFRGNGAGLTGLNASNLASGTVAEARIAAAIARDNEVLPIVLAGDGPGSGLDADLLDGLSSSAFWQLGGNSGTTPGTHFLGTTDNQPLEIKVHGLRALRLEDNGDSAEDTDSLSDGAPNVILGAPVNFVASGVVGATIGGGGTSDFDDSTFANSIRASYGTIGGGMGNRIAPAASWSTIAGGRACEIGTNSERSVIGGGFGNSIAANSLSATIPGGENNTATNYAFAAGRRAKAMHTGAFVWADATEADLASTANNQFLIRAAGGVDIHSPAEACSLRLTSTGGLPSSWPLSINQSADSVMTISNGGEARITMPADGNVGIGTNNPSQRLHVVGNILATGTITPNSDRNAKTDFAPVEPVAILEKVAALPISSWRFKAETQGVRHVGPMAQDFQSAFGLGEQKTAIATVDADGVALAAIQGLNQKLAQELKRRDAENAELKARVSALERLVANVTAQGN